MHNSRDIRSQRRHNRNNESRSVRRPKAPMWLRRCLPDHSLYGRIPVPAAAGRNGTPRPTGNQSAALAQQRQRRQIVRNHRFAPSGSSPGSTNIPTLPMASIYAPAAPDHPRTEAGLDRLSEKCAYCKEIRGQPGPVEGSLRRRYVYQFPANREDTRRNRESARRP